MRIRNIPSIINVICILYFRDEDSFDILSKNGIKLSENKKVITKLHKHTGLKYLNYNYGITDIPSMNNSIYTWKLKIIGTQKNGIDIGITSKVIIGRHRSMPDEECIYYTFSTNDRNGVKTASVYPFYFWEPYGIKWKKDDEITMCLDLKQMQIKLMINDMDQGIAFKNIPKSSQIHYRFFVILGGIGHCLEIISFSQE